MTATDGDDLGTVLGVWAHPDDEAFLSAGLMARARTQGRRVVCVTATKGEAGFPDDHPGSVAERAAIRETELRASMAALGVVEHRWLGFPDGGCRQVPDEVGRQLVLDLIEEIRPDTLLTFPPDGITGHSDHISVCRWSTLAVDALAASPDRAGTRARPRLLYATKSTDWNDVFMKGIDPRTILMVEDLAPDITAVADLAVWLHCDDETVARKVAALRAQASQLDGLVQMMGLDYFVEFCRDEFFRAPTPADPAGIATATVFGKP